MKTIVAAALIASLCVVHSQDLYGDLAQPSPYQFGYTATSDEGSHGHSETFDGTQRAEGTYFLKLADGRERTVTYTADENGFHPEIQTNELGTESKNPGGALLKSSAPTGPDAAIQADTQARQ